MCVQKWEKVCQIGLWSRTKNVGHMLCIMMKLNVILAGSEKEAYVLFVKMNVLTTVPMIVIVIMLIFVLKLAK